MTTCYSPRESERVCFTGIGLSVCLCVCLSVTTITKKIVDGFVPNFMGRFLEGREDQVRVSLRSVEGCGSNGQGELYLPQNFAFAGCCTLSEYFPSGFIYDTNISLLHST